MTKHHTDDPSATPTAIVVVVFTLLVVITILALQAYFSRVQSEEFQAKVVSETPAEKEQVFAEQRKLLSEYRWIDKDQGIVGIPVERAMQLEAAELRRQQQQQQGGTK